MVTKISSCWVYMYAISRQELNSCKVFWFCFPFFPLKAAGDHAHSSLGNPLPMAFSNSPVRSEGLRIKNITIYSSVLSDKINNFTCSHHFLLEKNYNS